MHDFSILSEKELLMSLQRGNPQAFAQIYKTYWYPLYQTALARLKNREVAEEIVQELFIQLWERRENLQIGKLENYLFRALKYSIIDLIRAQVVQDRYLDHYQAFTAQEETTTEEETTYDTLRTCLEQGLNTLPEKTRNIFVLSRIEGWPVSRIASHFQVTDKAVEYHLTKSLKTLRLYLKGIVLTAPSFLCSYLF
ncbi:RNA polymerase sigma-70 factor [Nibrella saemangeumensis]|uniref:RNA polymerase sigma-70 factor n=1 Tax=Nibrella saemangeumensis TaxID=1084526 RepID=A0ABP8MQ67_9BACT